jgi:hypothetical protein
MQIEIPTKTREKIIHLMNQRFAIENEINLICTTILEMEKIEVEKFVLNNELTHIEVE